MFDDLYSVSQVAKKLQCNPTYVYQLINAGLLPALEMGSMKVPKENLIAFQQKYSGWDIKDPFNPKPMFDDDTMKEVI